jgi:hypothetical protein
VRSPGCPKPRGLHRRKIVHHRQNLAKGPFFRAEFEQYVQQMNPRQMNPRLQRHFEFLWLWSATGSQRAERRLRGTCTTSCRSATSVLRLARATDASCSYGFSSSLSLPLAIVVQQSRADQSLTWHSFLELPHEGAPLAKVVSPILAAV